MRPLALALLLAGCATTSASQQVSVAERQTERVSASSSTQAVAVEVRREEGPVERVTTIEEYVDPGPAPVATSTPAAPPREAVLKRRTVIREHVGAVVTETHAAVTGTASSLAETHATSTVAREADQHRDVRPAASCAFGGVVWGLGAVALVLAVLVWRRRA